MSEPIEPDTTHKNSESRVQQPICSLMALLLGTARDGIAIFGQDHRVIEANQQFADMLGYSLDEVLQLHTWDFDASFSEAQIRQSFADLSHASQIFRTRHRRKDGTIFDVEVSVKGGVIEGQHVAITVCRDLTERLNVEKALRESQENQEEAQAVAKIGSWSLDIENSHQHWSRQTFAIFGISPDSTVDVNSFAERIHPDDASSVEQAWQRALRDGEYLIDHRILVEGQVKWVRDRARIAYNESGRPVRAVGTVQDISEEQRILESLRASEERYRIIADYSPDWQYWLDSNNHYLYVSPSCELITGYTAEEFLADPELMRRIVVPEDLPLWTSHIEQGTELSPRSERYHHTMEFRIRCRSGDCRWIEHQCIAVFNSTGQRQGRRGVNRDITERKRTEAQLEKVLLAVEQSPSSIAITDIHGTIEYVNEAFLLHSGYSKDEVIGQNPRILKSGNTSPLVYAEMWQTLTRGQVWKGELVNRRKDGVCYTEHAVIAPLRQTDGQTTHYVAVKENVTSSKEDKEAINRLAYFDILTGLPNRRFLLERLQHAVAGYARSNRESALLLIDLDHFNRVNDVHGHDVGDQLVRQVAQQLKSCLRESDTIARSGADEFLVLLENLSDHVKEAASQARSVCETIRSRVSRSYRINEVNLTCTVSIGVTLFSENADADDLLRRADLAMYQSKSAGRNTMRFFDPEMQEVVTKRALLEADLREALLREQFLLHYQPQVRNQKIVGAEALLRWNHPGRGAVSPAEFIPVAEEGPLILSIGRWVLQSACRKLYDWSHRSKLEHLTLSVNVSARQFKQPDFVAEVIVLVRRYGVNPERLKLELTENLLLDNVEEMIAKMAALKALGICFALDDFGTGYSSLSYLKRLPLDELKIDQGFVRDMLEDSNDAAIARMVIALGISMGLDVIAEGVESTEQQKYLAEHGCVAYQGYLYGHPVVAKDFEQRLLTDSGISDADAV